MSAGEAGTNANEARPRTQQFRRAVRKPALSPDQKRRQAVVTAAAWRFFGTGTEMIAFLNGENGRLGGRPGDVAVDSDDGLATVLAALEPEGAAQGKG